MLLPALAACLAPQAFAQVQTAEHHARAIELARDARYEAALDLLATLRRARPSDEQLRDDELRVLGWAERDAELVMRARALDVLPLDVRLLAAKSARNLRDYPLAVAWYQDALLTTPNSVDAYLGLAMSQADLGAIDAARRTLAVTPARDTDRIALQLAEAYVSERANDPLGALRRYEDVLDELPSQRDALRGKALALRALLLPSQALALAREHEGILTLDEIARLEVDELAVKLRLTARTPYPPGERARALEDAINALDRAIAETDDPIARSTLRQDRVVALADANRSGEAISAFETLIGERYEPSAILLRAAAKAYLQARRPRDALDAVIAARALLPDDIELRFTEVYARLELEDYAEAAALASALSNQLPLMRADPEGRIVRGNPEGLRAEILAALVDAYADRLPAAQSRLEALLAAAPHNADARHELANVYRWRGWLDRSLFEYRQVLTNEPALLSARTGHAHAELDARRYRSVAATLDELESAYPRDPSVERLARRWRTHNLRELYVASRFGDASGDTFGNDQYQIDAYAYSRPWRYRWRGFVHSHDAFAEFPEGDGRRRRLGIGAEHRAERWVASAELSGNRDGGGSGLAATVDWRLTDRWSAGGVLDVDGRETQLRGERVGISTELLGGYARFAPHEAASVEWSSQLRRRSDGNTGASLGVEGRRRLVNQPTWKLEFQGSFETSRNDTQSVPYFSPVHDRALLLGLAQNWRIFGRYERRLDQAVSIEAGRYAQADFSTGSLWRGVYRLDLSLSDRLAIGLAAERARMFYDGAPEYQTFFQLDLRARF